MLFFGRRLGVGMALVWLVACSTPRARPTVDPEGPEVRVRVHDFEMVAPSAGEELGFDPSALGIVSARVCGIFTEIGGHRMNCLTDEDMQQLMKAEAMRATLGAECDEGPGDNCQGNVLRDTDGLLVRGSLAKADGQLVLDLAVLQIDPPARVVSKRIRATDIAGLIEEVEQTSREFAWVILGAR